jgi:hypothetical protein
MESSLFSITYSIFGMLDFCNKNQIKENQGDKRREREKKREKKVLPKGFPFLCCYGLNRGGVSKSLP